jgi:hypothetical protein
MQSNSVVYKGITITIEQDGFSVPFSKTIFKTVASAKTAITKFSNTSKADVIESITTNQTFNEHKTFNDHPIISNIITEAITDFNQAFNTDYSIKDIPPIKENKRLTNALAQFKASIQHYTIIKQCIELSTPITKILKDNKPINEDILNNITQVIKHELCHFFEFNHFNDFECTHSTTFIKCANTLKIPATKSIQLHPSLDIEYMILAIRSIPITHIKNEFKTVLEPTMYERFIKCPNDAIRSAYRVIMSDKYNRLQNVV